MAGHRLADVDAVPVDGSLAFILEDDGETREVLVTRLTDGAITAWENHCQHWTDVRLDRGDGAVVRGDELLCRKHGAMFRKATGLCTRGPCEGAYLDPVQVAVEDDAVVLEEPGWGVRGPGVETDAENDARGGLDL